jgi:hypothetical protein
MYIRARFDAYLDLSVGSLDTISAEPLRTWKVTGTDAAIEAFRVAVGGVVVPDKDVVVMKTGGKVAAAIVEKVAQKTVIEANLAEIVAELLVLHTIPVEVIAKPVEVVVKPLEL